MNNVSVENNKPSKCDFAIKLLSITAFVYTLLSSNSYFFYYVPKIVNGERICELAFNSPNLITLVSFFLSIASPILFVLYIFKFCTKTKATILVPIIFAMISFEILFEFLTKYSLFYHGASFAIIQLLALISSLKGFNKKFFVIIAMSIRLLYETLPLIDIFSIIDYSIDNSMHLYIFSHTLSIIGSISFYVALLLFAIKNRIPEIISVSIKKKSSVPNKH